MFTFTPVGGGAPITIRSNTPDLTTAAGALPPGTQFEVQAVGVISATRNSPPSNKLRFVTAAAGAPGAAGTATSPTGGKVALTPPAGSWTTFRVSVCPVKGPAADCQTFDCAVGQRDGCIARNLQELTTCAGCWGSFLLVGGLRVHPAGCARRCLGAQQPRSGPRWHPCRPLQPTLPAPRPSHAPPRSYTVTSYAFNPDGSRSPDSNEAQFTTPE